MGSNVVIVAIPDENDLVWKISSEKIPHLTLLFLGEEEKISNLDQIMLFVEHAANTTLRRFYLPVDRRGELGDDKADVLFFKKGRYDYKAVHDFRSALLQDTNIKTAYDSASQFEGPWKPHLTLGYPTAPAKPIPNDHISSIYDVRFDKIAVWTGNFEGMEFVLKDYSDDFDLLENVPMGVAMSDLQHFGTKGMKWGVRKQEVGSGGHIRISEKSNRATPSTPTTAAVLGSAFIFVPVTPLAFLSPRVRAEVKASRAHNKLNRADKKWNKQLQSAKMAAKVHNQAAADINKQLPGFNSDKRWQNADGTKIHLPSNPKKLQEYNRAASDEVLNPAYAKAAISVHGAQSPSGRYKFTIEDTATATMKVTDTLVEKRSATHADGDDELSVRFKIVRDANGHIRGITLDEDETEMAQTVELGEEFLEHFGTKGMKWGVRKQQAGGAAKSVGRAAKATGRFIGDTAFEAHIQTETGQRQTMVDIDTMARKAFKRTDLPALKERHGDYGKMRNRAKKPFSKEARSYRKDARETYIKRLEDAANSMTNVSGNRQYTIRERGWELPASGGALPKSKHVWEVTSREIQHADGDVTWDIEVIEDGEGYISDLKPVESQKVVAQSAADIGAEFVLEHFGIKGMRWGVRKQREVSVETHIDTGLVKRRTKLKAQGGEAQPAHSDAVRAAVQKQKLKKSGTDALSTHELQDLARRLQLEAQVETLATKKGKKFASKQLEEQGKQQIQKGIGTGVRKGAPYALKKAKKGAATVAVTALL